jgi:hypothetical protein
MNNEPVAYINVEERKLEWAKPMTWHTPTIAQMDKVPLYTHPARESKAKDRFSNYESICLQCGTTIYKPAFKTLTDEEIHNIYIHMSGKAEGISSVTGKADFPVLFARAIEEWYGIKEAGEK